ncbi:MAG: VOC family protein [Deltaproteobacteria bacterium]|nr:VOC family protein [Deltaproteobacteria bacterium]
MLKKLTPVIVVEEIEPHLSFWVDLLGFEIAIEVLEGERLGFVILAKDGVELMMQSRASLRVDNPKIAGEPYREHTPLYFEVDDLDGIKRALVGADVLIAERTTFYRARETIVRTSYGQVVTFAQRLGS